MHSWNMRYSVVVGDTISCWLECGNQDLISINLNRPSVRLEIVVWYGGLAWISRPLYAKEAPFSKWKPALPMPGL